MPDEAARRVLLAAAAVVQRRLATSNTNRPADRMAVKLNGNGDAEPVQVTLAADGYAVTIGGKTVSVRTDWRPGEPLLRAEIDGSRVVVQIDRDGIAWRLTHRGATVSALVLSPRVAELARLMPKKRPPDTSKFLLSPMPGLLKSVAVAEGQEVKAGEELAVVEAMKMENILRAPRDGKVAKRHAAPGDSLAVDQKILEFA
jgi:propionyl-CoA carboxylase alpha subunit